MGPPHLSNAVRWQIIGMREAGMSLRQIAQRVGHHHSTVSRIVNIHRLTNDVKDRSRSERSRITSRREDNALGPLVRRNPFANSTVLKRQWLPHRLLSARTVRNRLKYVGYRSRRHIKRCLLTHVHKSFPFAMVPNTSSMEFGLVEESSLIRRTSLLVARDKWQSARMTTTEHCLC